MKRVINCAAFLIRESVKRDKTLILLDIIIGFMRESQTLINVFLPAAILTLILLPDNINKAVIVVAAVNVILLGMSVYLERARRNLSLRAGKIINYLQCGLNRKVMSINYVETERKDALDMYYKASDGLWNTDDVHYMLFTVIFCKALTFLITFLVFTKVHILVACCVFATVLIEYFVNIFINKKQYKHESALYVVRNQRQYVDDVLFTQKAVRDMVFNDSKSFLLKKRYDLTKKMNEISCKSEGLDFGEEIITAFLSLIRTVVVYTIAMGQYFLGRVTLSDFLLFTGAAQQMTNTLFQITNAASYVGRAANYYQDYLDYTELSESDRKEGNLSVPSEIHSIEFCNVSFRYANKAEDAVHNVSFKLMPNETTAIVGDNGAGKSTIIKLLLRLYKVSDGDILLNGVSIYDYIYDEYIALLAPVFQDFNLYSVSIKDNISCGEEYEDDKLYFILDQVGLKKKVLAFPGGIDTPYSKRFHDDGVQFSGGEEQKLAISRAFAKKSHSSLILDEPTDSLDPFSEFEINKLITEISTSALTILISHRLNSARLADRIIVMNEGTIVENGNHDELMSIEDGVYKKMFDMQGSYYK